MKKYKLKEINQVFSQTLPETVSLASWLGQHHWADAMWPGSMAAPVTGQSHTHPHPATRTPRLASQQADPLLNHRGSLRCEGETMWTEKSKFMTTPGESVLHSLRKDAGILLAHV